MVTTFTLPQLTQKLRDAQEKHNRDVGQYELLCSQHKKAEDNLAALDSDIGVYTQSQVLLSKASDFARTQLIANLQNTVSAGLQAVYDDDPTISFGVDTKTVNGKPSAEWLVTSGLITANPEDAKGGGVVDVVSLCLRLTLLELSRPKPQGFVALDEAGKHISKDYLPNVAEFLKKYLAKTGRQGIMVTHHDVLAGAANVAYRVKQDRESGVSTVTKDGGVM